MSYLLLMINGQLLS